MQEGQIYHLSTTTPGRFPKRSDLSRIVNPHQHLVLLKISDELHFLFSLPEWNAFEDKIMKAKGLSQFTSQGETYRTKVNTLRIPIQITDEDIIVLQRNGNQNKDISELNVKVFT